MNSDELEKNGPTGTALIVLHIIEDKLWASGPKVILEAALPAAEEQKVQETNDGEKKPEEIEETKLENEPKKSEEGSEDGDSNADEEEKVAPEVMDEYLMEAFLTSLKISLDEKELPLDGGEFYSNHVLPCKREGVYIDVKNTSYKKLGKFLQAMAKLGIIDFKEVKKGAAPQITRVNKTHPK